MKKKITTILFIIAMMLSCGVVSAAPKSPNVAITTYSVDQKAITPGSAFKITLNLKNYGEYHGRKVEVSLSNEQGQENLGNFSPLNQSNIQYIDMVKAGKTAQITYNMFVSPKVVPGNYNIIVKISYMDSNGTAYEEVQTIGLLVTEKDSIQILANEDLGDLLIGEPLEAEVQIVNNGVAEAKGISVSVQGKDTDTLMEYLGNFNSGDYDNYGFTIIGEEPGKHTVKVDVKYYNSLNELITVEKDITYNVLSNKDGNSTENSHSQDNWFVKLIKGIFGLS